MTISFDIRSFEPADLDPVLELYPAAFPEEELRPLVKDLARCDDALGFVATKEDRIVGHIAYTVCGLENDSAQIALLAPLAVHPEFAKRGIGSALVKAGNDAMRDNGATVILVLGDPLYYSRFGFASEETVQTPYPLPEAWEEAWQSIWFKAEKPNAPDKLIVPAPWQSPALWS